MKKVLIADGHPAVLLALRHLISGDEGIGVLVEARSGWEVIEKLAAHKVDLAVLDMRMPGPCGIELIRRLRRDSPDLLMLVFSAIDEPDTVRQAIQAGASGYIAKASDLDILLAGVRQVLQGRSYIDPAVAEKVIRCAQVHEKALHEQLSRRERQVLGMIGSGKANKDIARRLNLSVKTISTYKTRIKDKLSLESNIAIYRYAIEHDISEDADA